MGPVSVALPQNLPSTFVATLMSGLYKTAEMLKHEVDIVPLVDSGQFSGGRVDHGNFGTVRKLKGHFTLA